VVLCEEERENYYRHNEDDGGEPNFLVRVTCGNKSWTVRRTMNHFATLDRQLHRCIFDRKFSQLPELHVNSMEVKSTQVVTVVMVVMMKMMVTLMMMIRRRRRLMMMMMIMMMTTTTTTMMVKGVGVIVDLGEAVAVMATTTTIMMSIFHQI
jgi:hypothetical protein